HRQTVQRGSLQHGPSRASSRHIGRSRSRTGPRQQLPQPRLEAIKPTPLAESGKNHPINDRGPAKGYQNDALKGVKIPNFQQKIKKAGSGAMARKMKKGAYEFIDEMIFGDFDAFQGVVLVAFRG